MGNDNQENNFEKIDPNEIIENDCYEEIDLQKINKIIEKEKSWNKNSIVVSLNEFDLKKLNEDNKVLEYKNENEKNNLEDLNKVIEEQKNECGSQDEKNKEVKEEEQNNNNKDDNNDKKENEVEKKEIKEIKEIKETNEVGIIENENNKNEINNNIQTIINISNQQDEIKKEDEVKDNKNTNNEIKNIKSIHNQVKEKINKKINKLKNKKARIRPKNTSDEALKGAGNNNNLQKKGKEAKKNNDKSTNKKDVKTDNNENNNNNNDSKKDEKKESISPVEKKDPNEEFDIKNIIPEYRLKHLKDDEIIYSGTLEKILKIPDKNTIAYSQRFCIFTKNYFAYYKSKESYISLNKPMLLINNNFIIRIENTILDGGSYYFGIICEVNDETRNLINKVNSFVTNEANICELLLGFRTKEYENMMKWVIVLRYFISNQNNEF